MSARACPVHVAFNHDRRVRLTVCTIAVALQGIRGAPVALAANREERYDRPASPPAVVTTNPAVFAPTDTVAGGTWIGINEFGLAAAIANRPSPRTGDRSRGWIVRDALACSDVAAATDAIRERVREHTYAGFMLVLIDNEQASTITWNGEWMHRPLESGVHVITNNGVNGETAKSATIRSRLMSLDGATTEAWTNRTQTVLADHASGACEHGQDAGTRSSSIIACDEDGTVHYQFADGPPCVTSYETYLDGPIGTNPGPKL